jgi:hypothetical protein
MAQAKAAPATAPDWERIEALYRAGAMSVREIAAEHGVSHVAIGKRAKKHEWTRDLRAKVQAKADALVTKALVTSQVTAETKITERVAVEASAQMQARVRLAHRSDAERARTLAATLLKELEHQTGHQVEFEQLAELLIDPAGEEGEEASSAAKERQRKRMEAFQRVMSLSGRADTMKKLAETLRIVVAIEREAYGIGDAAEKPDDPKLLEATNATAREIVYALQLGLQRAAKPANEPTTAAKAA